MKRISTIALVVFLSLCLLFSSNAYAETSTLYEFPEFTIRIPDNYFVYTQENSADILTFEDGLVFGAINTNTFDEINVRCLVENPNSNDFNSIGYYKDDDEKFLQLLTILYPELSAIGNPVKIYRHPQTPFVVYEGCLYEDQGYTIFYLTSVKLNKKNHWFSITGICRTKEKNNTFANDLQYIVSSLNLVEYPDFEMPELSNDKKESKTTYSFPESYVDPMSNTSFIPPRGWRSIDKSKEGKYTGVMFVSDRNSSTLIGYSCVDFWDAIDESERSILELLGISRKDIDNTYITKDIIANSYGCSPEDVGSQFYANQEFYVIKTTTTSSVFHGYDVSAPTTMFVCVNNGYQYSFFYASFKESSSSSWFTIPTTEFDYMMNSLSFGQNK